MGHLSTGTPLRVSAVAALVAALLAGGWGCARMPFTTKVIHEDQRAIVKLQHEVDGTTYTHPALLTTQDIHSILQGFSLREQQQLPLRWFAEEQPPKKLFHDDELAILAGSLADALGKAKPQERVAFELRAPGHNPAEERDVTAGWLAIRDDLLHLEVQYFHVMVPKHRIETYDVNYATVPPPKRDYLLYFEPGRFWGKQPGFDAPVLKYKAFLQANMGGAAN
ncbi:hypothetical protein YTPLAS18_14710 [Nitrospira sp.]|nr:hypothetical protein YTPLAS18_14710 [Nitrospira sp.]